MRRGGAEAPVEQLLERARLRPPLLLLRQTLGQRGGGARQAAVGAGADETRLAIPRQNRRLRLKARQAARQRGGEVRPALHDRELDRLGLAPGRLVNFAFEAEAARGLDLSSRLERPREAGEPRGALRAHSVSTRRAIASRRISNIGRPVK
ncbi:MAG: hypothetical protein IPL88_01120 [Rhizobiales bacterium]|nr:hypothetical protein [Hyphomicrobiales bacterium]